MGIPLIDFSECYSDIKVRVTEALAEYGCFEAIFPDLKEEFLRPLFVEVRELVELPVETKQKCPRGEILPGYNPPSPSTPLFQSIGLENPVELQNLESMAKALWPADANPKLCKMLHSYSQKMQMYDQMVRKIVAESLGIDAYLDEHMESSLYALRVNKYDTPKSGEAELGLGPHSDLGYLTIEV